MYIAAYGIDVNRSNNLANHDQEVHHVDKGVDPATDVAADDVNIEMCYCSPLS